MRLRPPAKLIPEFPGAYPYNKYQIIYIKNPGFIKNTISCNFYK